ncbi:hypothetical protein KOW79_005242 [Hemibagrus wyckioides]|uniref:Uncharacterized protein n=1 Tax=Hemibagrus wyckioides TaxID=337641 RepID=A0A9D3P1L5_9TELE|nr:hypothetical protein KOW79_005242 [Hemibagrus wyckioides]
MWVGSSSVSLAHRGHVEGTVPGTEAERVAGSALFGPLEQGHPTALCSTYECPLFIGPSDAERDQDKG